MSRNAKIATITLEVHNKSTVRAPNCQTMRVFVGHGVAPTRRDILDKLERFGPIEEFTQMTGFSFVQYRYSEDGHRAIRALDGTSFFGRRLRVEVCNGSRAVSPAPRRDSHRDSFSHLRSRDAPSESDTLFIAGYDDRMVSPRDIEDAFKGFGRIVRCNPVRDYFFIQYGSESDAKRALLAMNGTMLKGRRIDVKYAHARRHIDENRKYGNGDRRPRSPRPPRRGRSRSRSFDRGRMRDGEGPYKESGGNRVGGGDTRSNSPPPHRGRSTTPRPLEQSPPREIRRFRSRSPVEGASLPRRGESSSPSY